MSTIKKFVVWVLSNWAWVPFSTGVGGALTVLIGYAVDLPGAWYVVFLICLFVATVALVSLPARISWAYAQQHGPLANERRATQATRAAYSEIETELLVIQSEVLKAIDTQTWWSPSIHLPDHRWREHGSKLAGGGTSEERELFRACQAIYVLVAEGTRIVHRNYANPPTAEHVRILENLRDRVADGLAILSQRLDSQAANS